MSAAGPRPVRVAVFASGGGTNLQALLDHFHGDIDRAARIAVVISDRADAGALKRAADAGVATCVVPVAGRPAEDVAGDTLAALDDAGAEIVALAGYLKLVPSAVVRRFRLRMINVHPALLPAFGGKGLYGARVHRAVIEAGCRVSGATVHFVDEEYDTGPILAQWPVPVLAGDSSEALAARVLRVEHRLFPAALELLARTLADGHDLAGLVAREARPGFVGSGAFLLADHDAPDADTVRASLGIEP